MLPGNSDCQNTIIPSYVFVLILHPIAILIKAADKQGGAVHPLHSRAGHGCRYYCD